VRRGPNRLRAGDLAGLRAGDLERLSAALGRLSGRCRERLDGLGAGTLSWVGYRTLRQAAFTQPRIAGTLLTWTLLTRTLLTRTGPGRNPAGFGLSGARGGRQRLVRRQIVPELLIGDTTERFFRPHLGVHVGPSAPADPVA